VEYQKNKTVTLVVLAGIILIAAVATFVVVKKEQERRAADNAANQALVVGESEIPYTDLSGNPIALSHEQGSTLVVNSWASWSPDSAQELPLLAKLASQYAEQGVKVVAINRAEPQTTAERYLRTVGAADTVQLVLDQEDRFYRSISGFAMPETIFYDQSGNIVHHQHGVLTEEQMITYVEQALAAKTKE